MGNSHLFQKRFLKKEGSELEGLYLKHTGLIGSKPFQNYAFKGCISLKTLKFWLLVLTRTFFNGNNHRLTALVIRLQDLYELLYLHL